MSASRYYYSLVWLLVCPLAGCFGGDEGQVAVYPVSGKVTLNGAPVANASVMFSPKGDQPVATGRTDAKGEYTLTTYEGGDGAAAGDYVPLVVKDVSIKDDEPRVTHSATGAVAIPQHTGPTAATNTSSLPAKYSDAAKSDLKATVKEDDNVINLELKL